MSKNINKILFSEVKKELLELNFNVNSIGIIYWIECIKFIKLNPMENNIMEVYKHISEKYKINIPAVERAMRQSMKQAKENIRKKLIIQERLQTKLL